MEQELADKGREQRSAISRPDSQNGENDVQFILPYQTFITLMFFFNLPVAYSITQGEPINLPAQLSSPTPLDASEDASSYGASSLDDLQTSPIDYNKWKKTYKNRANIGLKINTAGIGLRGQFFQHIHEYVDITEQLSYERSALNNDTSSMTNRIVVGVGPSIKFFKAGLFAPYASIQAGYEREKNDISQLDAAIALLQMGMHIRMTKNFWLSLTRSDIYYSSFLTRISSEQEVTKPTLNSVIDAHFTLAF